MGAHIKLQPQIKTWVFFIVYKKGDLVKEPMKSRDVFPRNVPGVGWGEGGHESTEDLRNFAYVMLNWINFTNNYHTVDLLTVIYMQMIGKSDPDKHMDL